MEVGVAFDDGLSVEEGAASLGNSGIEVIDGGKVLVDKRLVD
jgi:hypothetical protein